MSAAGALEVIEAGDRVKAWIDGVRVDATRVMAGDVRATVLGGPAAEAELSVTARDRLASEARSLTSDEIELATGLGTWDCHQLVGFASAPVAATGAARELLRRGECSFRRASIVWEQCKDLAPHIAGSIAGEVLGARPDGSPWSQQQFRARLRTRVRKHEDREATQRRHAQSLAQRRCSSQLFDDGTGELVLAGDGPRVVAATRRVDALARTFRQQGDSRTLSQLRSDVALDLLMHGWVRPLVDAPPAVRTGEGRDAAVDPMAAYRALGEPPAAMVQLTVSLNTVLGLDDGVGQLQGYGAVSAQQARSLALREGSVWERVVTDPVTGWAIERSINRYRPDADMSRQCRTRDGTSRAPGSVAPALERSRVDLDHRVPYSAGVDGQSAGGPTCGANLFSLDRRSHVYKTRGYWTYDVGLDDTITWTTMTGRVYTTTPMDYDEFTGAGHEPPQCDQPNGSNGSNGSNESNESNEPQGGGGLLDLSDYRRLLARRGRWGSDDDLPLSAKPPNRGHRPTPPPTLPPDPGPPPF